MRFLAGTAFVAIIAFVGFFFWGEYAAFQVKTDAKKARNQAAIEDVRKQKDAVCDVRVVELNSWVNGKPVGESKSFAEARARVDLCLKQSEGTEWHDRNIHVKYW
ncbi:hypothetical protein ACLBWZ_16410 [Brucellaceae bacterium C25G]